MENSSLSATEIAVGSLLAGGGVGGNNSGGGAWGAGNSGFGPFASPGANAVRLDRNDQRTEDLSDAVKDTISAGFNAINSSFENATRDNQFSDLSREHTDLERRVNDQNSHLIALLNDFKADSAKCCCEAKLQNCKDHAELTAKIIEENSATRELIRGDALAAANSRITQLETINALSSHHGGGH